MEQVMIDSIKAPQVPWTHRLSKARPVLDEEGKPLREPVVNKNGFWVGKSNPLIKVLNKNQHGNRKTNKQ